MTRRCRQPQEDQSTSSPFGRRPARFALAFAGLCLIVATNELLAKPFEVIYPEGVSEGFVTLKNMDGKQLADGELSQLTTGAGRLASRLTFRFTDGSLGSDLDRRADVTKGHGWHSIRGREHEENR